jgi:DNA-binding LytR/AlgR family response regulator
MDCLIVDDDEMSRMLVRQLAENSANLNIIGEAANGAEAISLINQHPVDILFLDFELPDMTGYEILNALEDKPYVVMITSNKEHAAQAFEIGATDYLVKPITLPRFLQAVNRIQDLMKEKALPENTQDIFVRSDSKIVRLALNDILYVEALADYIAIHTEKGKYTVHSTMKGFNDRLPSNRFVRVHRSFIIQISKLDYIDGQYIVIGKANIPIGASYKESFSKLINVF